MKKTIKEIFWLDDRTGLKSTSKLIRVFTWIFSSFFMFISLGLVFSNTNLTQEDLNVLNMTKEFLIFLCGFTESSYQFNRSQKMKFGSLEAKKSNEEEDEENEEPETRKRIDL